jgi:hypothetical protein
METTMKQGDAPKDRSEEFPARPALLFWSVFLFFAALWTIVPTFLFPNFRLDIIEQFFVGREWTLGSGSHPALTAVVLDLIARISGIAVAPSLAAVLFHLLALWSIWCLAREYLRPGLALAATFAMFVYWYLFQMEGTRYNNSITLNAFWIFSAWLAYRAIDTEKIRLWFAAGTAIGIGLYFKYTQIVLALVIVLFLLTDRRKRRLWCTPGPWISTFTALTLFLPYILWLVRTGFFASVTYAVGNAPQKSGWTGHILAPLEFLSNQLPLVLPPILCLLPVGLSPRLHRSVDRTDWKYRYLNMLLFGPLVFNLLWSAAGGVFLRCDLGCHIWMPLTVWVLVHFGQEASPHRVKRTCTFSLFLDLLCLAGLCVLVPLAPLFEKNLPRYHFPGKDLAALAESIWHENHEGPLPWVTGAPWNHGALYDAWPWLAGNVSVYGHDRARVYSGPKHCSWGTAADVRREGGLFLWTPGDRDEEILEAMKADFPNARLLGTYTIKPKTKFAKGDVSVGIALIPPAPDERSQPMTEGENR